MIERQNILKLLGKDKRKFHSCYITCYSFDFLFFELRVLPTLRATGIKNVNVLVDSAMFQQSLKTNISSSLAGRKSYSIIPIDSKGAFHPKMMIVFGKKEGVAIIGSGNLTSSGLSSNEEIWGSFHIDEISEKNYSIFRDSFDLLTSYLKDSNQSHKNKLNWLHKNTTWLESVQKSKIQVEQKDNSTIQLLSNNGSSSIYRQILQIINEPVVSVFMIAPFYNKNASLINSILFDVSPHNVTCVIDSQYGTWPTSNNQDTRVSYLDWSYENQDCHKRGRLHAKILQLDTSTSSYFLFGSANMTKEAMGTSDTLGKNTECCLLIKTPSTFDYLNALGIHLEQFGSVEIAKLLPRYNEYENDEKLNLKYKILHSEISTNIIRIIIDQEISTPITIQLQDIEGNTIEKITNDKLSTDSKHKIRSEKGGIIFKVALIQEDEIVSNFAFMHHTDLIIKTNPDSSLSLVIDYLDKENLSDKDLCSLLQQISFTEKSNSYSNSAVSTSSKTIEIPQEEVQQVPEEEFNRNEDVRTTEQKHSLAMNSMLEMILEKYYSEVGTKSDDVSDSDETKAMLAGDEGLEEPKTQNQGNTENTYSDNNGLKNMIEKAVKKITTHLSELDNGAKPDHDEIIHANIACQLILGHSVKCFEERRYLIIISRNNQSGDLKQLKSIERKFKLLTAVQKNPYLTNISYTVNSKHLENLEREIDQSSCLRLIYHDESPSQIINHSYIDLLPWSSNNQFNKTKGYEAFQLHGIGNLLSNILYWKATKKVPLFNNDEDQDKFEFYSNKLYTRLLLIMSLQNWTSKTIPQFQLLVLNLHYVLVGDSQNQENVIDRVNQMIKDQNLERIINPKSKLLVEHSLTEFNKWCSSVLKQGSNKSLLKKEIIDKIVFSRKIGFARIKAIHTDLTIDLISPLGNKYDDLYGYKEIFIGRTVYVF